MTAAPHSRTPAPWHVVAGADSFSVFSEHGAIAHQIEGREDAALLAAAPDLLTAAKLVEEALAVLSVFDGYSAMRRTVLEAIARAEAVA